MTNYHRPATLDEALAFRAAHDVQVLAGGTDIYPAFAARRAWGDPAHKPVLDISAVPDLRGIADEGEHWRFGALTTWTELIRADLPPLFDGYRMAAREVGGVQIQNRGTLVGNICTASPAGDGIPCLLTLDAKVELTSLRGIRVVPLAEFITGYRATVTAPDEIVTALLVPKTAGQGRFHKLGARKYLVISIVMVAAAIDVDETGVVRTARLAVGSCSGMAKRMPALELAVRGQRLAEVAHLVTAEHLAGLAPIDDIRATGAYRQDAALTLMRDVLAGFGTRVAWRVA
jgi:CO/xanthine dehydrogenase FAD-binding subunit